MHAQALSRLILLALSFVALAGTHVLYLKLFADATCGEGVRVRCHHGGVERERVEAGARCVECGLAGEVRVPLLLLSRTIACEPPGPASWLYRERVLLASDAESIEASVRALEAVYVPGATFTLWYESRCGLAHEAFAPPVLRAWFAYAACLFFVGVCLLALGTCASGACLAWEAVVDQ